MYIKENEREYNIQYGLEQMGLFIVEVPDLFDFNLNS